MQWNSHVVRSFVQDESKSPAPRARRGLSWLLCRSNSGGGTEQPVHVGLASQHRPYRSAGNQGPETAAGTYRAARHHRTCRTGRKPARTNSARHSCGARRLIENHGRTRTIVDGWPVCISGKSASEKYGRAALADGPSGPWSGPHSGDVKRMWTEQHRCARPFPCIPTAAESKRQVPGTRAS